MTTSRDQRSDAQRIDPVLVEKVKDALVAARQRPFRTLDDEAEAAIRAVFDELGLKEERRDTTIPLDADCGEQGVVPMSERRQVRYAMDWRDI